MALHRHLSIITSATLFGYWVWLGLLPLGSVPGTGFPLPDIVRDVGLEGLSDADLWGRVTAHDGEAFAVLFDRHATKVYNHCFRRSADWSMAEDLTSVVFLEAWRKRRQVRLHGDSVLPWLLAVANNCLRNAERSRRRYHRLLAKLPSPEDTPPFDAQASDRVEIGRAHV